MPTVRPARRGPYAAALAGLLCMLPIGCSQLAARSPQPNDDIFAETLPPFDAHKAELQLRDIKPAVEPPSHAPDLSPIPAKAQRAIDRAIELRRERRFTEAALDLEKALRYAPNSQVAHRELALTQWEAGNTDSAKDHIETVLASGDDDIICHYILGRLAARRFENTEAIEHLRTALLCSVDDTTRAYQKLAEYHLAEVLRAEGFLTAAIDLYERFRSGLHGIDLQAHPNRELAALQRAGDTPILESIADACANLRRWDLAAEYLNNAYADREIEPAARIKYAKTLARAGRLEEASQQARAALPDAPEAMNVLARIRQAQDKPDAFISDLRSAAAERPEDTTLILALAGALTNAGRNTEAIAWLRKNASVLPDNAELTWALFDALVERHEWADAFAVAAAAIRSNESNTPDAKQRISLLAKNEDAWSALGGKHDDSDHADADADVDFAVAFLRGVGAAALGDGDEAYDWFTRAISLEPAFVAARIACGELLLKRNEWQRAIEIAAPDGLDLAPDSRIAYLLGRAYLGLDELDQAEGQLQTAVRLNRQNTAAMLDLARLYAGTGQPNRAMRQLETLVKADPINERGREMLFEAYLQDGDHRAAAEQLAELRRLAASPTCIARCVARIEYNPALPQSEERYRTTLEEAMKAHRPDVETLSLVAESYEREQRYVEAIATLEKAIALGPVGTKTTEQLARCYRLNLQFDESLRELQRMAKRHPNRIAVKAAALDTLLILQRFDDAIAMASAMLAETDADSEMAGALRGTLVRTYLLKEDYKTAIDTLRAWRLENPQDVVLLRWLIATYQDAGQDGEALALIREWAKDIPSGFAAIDLSRIWANLPANQREEVVQLVLEDVLEDPNNDILQATLIDLLRSSKRFDEAIELADNNAAAGRDGMLYRTEVYRTYAMAGRFDDAIELLNVMLAESASTRFATAFTPVDLRVELAQLLIRSGKIAKALDKLNRWFEAATTNDERLVYLSVLAYAHQEAGDLIEAIEALSLALELDPTDVGLHNDLGYTLADEGRDLDRAEQLIRFAVAREPRNSAYLDSIGWVLYKKGEFAEAAAWLIRARRAGEGEDPVVCRHLGDTYWRLGKHDDAVRLWQEAAKFATERIEDSVWPSDLDRQTRDAVTANIAAAQAGDKPQLAPTGPPAR